VSDVTYTFTTCEQTVTLDPWKRVSYAHGSVLGINDFLQAELRFLAAERRQNRALHGYGTVCGLEVGVADTASGPEVRVGAGLAIDPGGRWIWMPEARCALINEWLRRNSEALDWSSRDSSPVAIEVSLVLRYREFESDPVPVPMGPCSSRGESMRASRVAESFVLDLSLDQPDQAELRTVQSFARLLGKLRVVPSGTATIGVSDLEAEVRALVSTGALSATASPPEVWEIPEDEVRRYLGAAFRIWVTEVRPALLPRTCAEGDPSSGGIQLAHLTFPLMPGEATTVVAGDAAVVALDESERPYVLHTQLLQELMLNGAATGTGVNRHGALLGLDEDDHAQYLLVADRGSGATEDVLLRDLSGSGAARVTGLPEAAAAGQAMPHGQTAEGDLTGSYPAPVVKGVHGLSVPEPTESDDGRLLGLRRSEGGEMGWQFVVNRHGSLLGLDEDDHSQYLLVADRGSGTTEDVLLRDLSGNGAARVTGLPEAEAPGQAMPHGQAAGGDLAGSYPGPIVSGLHGRAVPEPAEADAGRVLGVRRSDTGEIGWDLVAPPQGGGGGCTAVVAPGEDIQAAIDSLPADSGGCVCLRAGEHRVEQTLLIRKSNISLKGESACVVLRRTTPGGVLSIDGGASDVKVEGIHFAPSEAAGTIIDINIALRVSIRSCCFTIDGPVTWRCIGIKADHSEGISITECIFKSMWLGLAFSRCSGRLLIKGNLFNGSTAAGSSDAIFASNTIDIIEVTENTIEHYSHGIFIGGSNPHQKAKSARIYRNDVSQRRPLKSSLYLRWAIHAYGVSVVVDGNRVITRGDRIDAIHAFGVSARIANNDLLHEGETLEEKNVRGVDFGGIDATISDNQLRNYSYQGIEVRSAHRVVISGNGIQVGEYTDFNWGINISDQCHDVAVLYNRISGYYFSVAASGVYRFDATGNMIFGVTKPSVFVTQTGIAVMHFASANFHANAVRKCGYGVYVHSESQSLATANSNSFSDCFCGLGGRAKEWRIECNTVANGGLNNLDSPHPIRSTFLDVMAENVSIYGNHVNYTDVSILKKADIVQAIRVERAPHAGSAEQGRASCLICNNSIVGSHQESMIEMLGQESGRFENVIFSNNYCENHAILEDAVTVALRGNSGIAMGNMIRSVARKGGVCFDLGNMDGTFVGNVMTGRIINHRDFPSPSDRFNLVQTSA
jgi:hypothetical protein